jgi:hypothetical protein
VPIHDETAAATVEKRNEGYDECKIVATYTNAFFFS